LNTKPQLYRPGISGNPAGRPKGIRNYKTILEEAITQYETATGKSLIQHL